MRNYNIFLKKELFESLKTYKLLIMAAVFLFLGMSAPLTAMFMPEILKWAISTDPATAGMDLSGLITEPSAFDSWMQFFSSYIGQMGIFALVIVFSGMLSSEFSRGTLTIMLSKGLSRSAVILSKLTNALIIWTASYTLAALVAFAYTVYFFPGDSVPNLLLAIFCLWFFGVFLLALTMLMATLTKRGFACMLALGASAVVFIILNISPQIAKYNPASLVDLTIRLTSGTDTPRHVLPVFFFALISFLMFTALAIIVFSKSKKNRFKKIALVVGAAILCMAVTVFIGEEMPRRISVGRHIISEDITIGKGTVWELHGKLTLPRNADGKVPAVVLVHGSGPNDMDETIFDNKPFRDIAEYLSSNGIAVIRYNKRTLTHGQALSGMRGMTVWEETIEDAILATELVKADPRVDENNVFILGHSLGGMLAPRIHDMGGDYTGLILFAGSPRFLYDISEDQVNAVIDETENEDERLELISLRQEMDKEMLLITSLSDDEVKDTIFEHWGNMGYYWKDLYKNPVSASLDRVNVPILVMQPDDDVQVLTDVDFAMYKELLADRQDVTFILYPGLNHLFMPSTGRGISEIMDEYKIKSNVDPLVLRDIVEWVFARSRK